MGFSLQGNRFSGFQDQSDFQKEATKAAQKYRLQKLTLMNCCKPDWNLIGMGLQGRVADYRNMATDLEAFSLDPQGLWQQEINRGKTFLKVY